MAERFLNAMDRSTLYFQLSVIWLGLLLAVLPNLRDVRLPQLAAFFITPEPPHFVQGRCSSFAPNRTGFMPASFPVPSHSGHFTSSDFVSVVMSASQLAASLLSDHASRELDGSDCYRNNSIDCCDRDGKSLSR